MATSTTASPRAGRMIPIRRNGPRLRRECRALAAGDLAPTGALSATTAVANGPFGARSDRLAVPADTGLESVSIAVRGCRDNAVPSVSGAHLYRCRPTMPEREFTRPPLRQERPGKARTGIRRHYVTLITAL